MHLKQPALYYRTLKAAFSKAVVWEYLKENPLKKIKAPKVEKKFPVFISETELKAIIGNIRKISQRFIFFCILYRMRLGELVNMKWRLDRF